MGDDLRAEVAALRAEVIALRGDRESKRRARGWRRRGAALVVAGLVALTPLLGMAAAPPAFSDLGDAAEVHQGNIQAIGNAGITTGFADPNNGNARLYNPKGLVTREEMASFLARTAGLGGNVPVVNAQTAVTAQSAGSATTAGTAANAQQLGGQPASAYALKSDIPAGGGGGTGPTNVWYSFFNLNAPDTSVVLQNDPGQYSPQGVPTAPPRTIVTDPVFFGGHDLLLPLDLPQSLNGTAQRVTGYQICYATSTASGFGARIQQTSIVARSATGTASFGVDNTLRQSVSPSCFEVATTGTATQDAALYLRVRVNFSNQNDGETVALYSARVTLAP